MVALNKPAERDYRSVETYVFDKKPVVDEEYGFIYQKEDLITLRDGREMAFLDSVTEKMLQTFHCSLLQVSTRDNVKVSLLRWLITRQKIFCTKVRFWTKYSWLCSYLKFVARP